MEEALEIITALFDGARLDKQGRHFRTNRAYLHSRPPKRPPIYISAFGPKAAAVAGRWGDGVWTLADPDSAPEVIDAYKSAAEDAQREPGEVVLQSMFSWAKDDGEAFESARPWRGAQPKEFYTDDWHDPQAMYEHAEQTIDDEQLRDSITISSDPEVHADAIREVERMGATIVVLANVSAADPLGAIDVYREHVLPAVRGTRVG
jgi:coenzyme F420-dependent glucose-6-phosphate dehydrogenase